MADSAKREPHKKLKSVARAYYSGGAKAEDKTADAFAAMGVRFEEDQADAVEVFTECWPDNWMPFLVFASLETQWNVGQKTIIGLKYESIPGAFEEFGIKKKHRAEMRFCLRVMEEAALKLFNEKHG